MDELPQYKVSSITYDLNGNITGMERHGLYNGVDYMMDNLMYSYLSGSNKLSYVKDEHDSQVLEDEIQHNVSNTQKYFYDEMGRLVTDQIKNITIKYNHFNKVSEIYDATTELLKVKYAYNERGQKIRKTVYTIAPGSEEYEYVMITHYLNDLSGNVMAVYTDTRLYTDPPNVHLTELTLYGTGRLGLVNNMTENISPYVYELTDHIGNVRATVLSVKVSGAVEVLSYTDYYPHGSLMPGRHYESSNGYRYDFQGKEKDAELNWNNFELRMYDANLGRWMSPDPYREFHSPYLAMGNDPINRIDPDGGKSMDIGVEDYVSNVDEDPIDNRASDEMIERNNAIGEGGGWGSRNISYDFTRVVKDGKTTWYHGRIVDNFIIALIDFTLPVKGTTGVVIAKYLYYLKGDKGSDPLFSVETKISNVFLKGDILTDKEQNSMDVSHNRIGFVPLDLGEGYGSFQMANYRSNISIRVNQNQITVRVTSSNSRVADGQVIFGASASLVENGNVTQTKTLANGFAAFKLPSSQNVSLSVKGGWAVRYDYGGAAVPVYHPIFWPFSLNFTDNFKLK